MVSGDRDRQVTNQDRRTEFGSWNRLLREAGTNGGDQARLHWRQQARNFWRGYNSGQPRCEAQPHYHGGNETLRYEDVGLSKICATRGRKYYPQLQRKLRRSRKVVHNKQEGNVKITPEIRSGEELLPSQDKYGTAQVLPAKRKYEKPTIHMKSEN